MPLSDMLPGFTRLRANRTGASGRTRFQVIYDTFRELGAEARVDLGIQWDFIATTSKELRRPQQLPRGACC
jgi:hypothetical protein